LIRKALSRMEGVVSKGFSPFKTYDISLELEVTKIRISLIFLNILSYFCVKYNRF